MNSTKKSLLFGALATVAIFGLSQCKYDNANDLYGTGGNACDTSAVTFSEDISTIINNNCVGCHSDAGPSGGISLEGHANVADGALNGAVMNRVQRPTGDPLLMPPSGQLSECDQSKLRAWVNEGAPNN